MPLSRRPFSIWSALVWNCFCPIILAFFSLHAQSSPTTPMVTVHASDRRVSDVLERLTHDTQVKISYLGDPSKRVTVFVREQPIENALKRICEGAGCGFFRKDDRFTVISLPHASTLIERIKESVSSLISLSGRVILNEWDGEHWEQREQGIQFQAPDKLRLEELSSGRTLVASAANTMSLHPSGKYALQWERNLLHDWVEMTGGPASALAFGTDWSSFLQRYRADNQVRLAIINGIPAFALTFTQSKAQTRWVRDFVSSAALPIGYTYAAFKRPVLDEPHRIRLYFDIEHLMLVRREAWDNHWNLINLAEIDAPNAFEDILLQMGQGQSASITRNGTSVQTKQFRFPTTWRVYDSNHTTVQTWHYLDIHLSGSSKYFDVSPPLRPEMLVRDAELKAVTEYRQSRPDAHDMLNLALARWHFTEDADAALQDLRLAARLAPTAPLPWLEMGRIQSHAARFRDAEHSFLEAIHRAPDLLQAQLLLADVQMAAGNFSNAEKTLRKVSTINPATMLRLAESVQNQHRVDDSTHLFLKALLSAKPGDTTVALQAAMHLFMTAWSSGTMSPLTRALLETKQSANNPYAQLLLMWIALESRDTDEATNYLIQTERLAPNNLPLRLRLGILLETYGLRKEASASYWSLLALHPASTEALEARARLVGLAIDDEQYDNAAKLFFRSPVVARTHSIARIRHQLQTFRDLFERRLRRDALVVMLEELLESGFKRDQVSWLLANLYYDEGNQDKAIGLLERQPVSSKYKPLTSDLLLKFYYADNRLNKAEALLKILTRVEPEQLYWQSHQVGLQQRYVSAIKKKRAPGLWRSRYAAEKNASLQLIRSFPDDPDAQLTYALTFYNDPATHVFGTREASKPMENALHKHAQLREPRHDLLGLTRTLLAQTFERAKQIKRAQLLYRSLHSAAVTDAERSADRIFMLRSYLISKNINLIPESIREVLHSGVSLEEKRTSLAFLEKVCESPNLNGGSQNTARPQQPHALIVATVNQLAQRYPRDPAPMAMQAAVFLGKGKRKKSMQTLEAAALKGQTDPDLWTLAGDAYLLSKQPGDAIRCFEKALKFNPNQSYTHEKLMNLYLSTQDPIALEVALASMTQFARWEARSLSLIGGMIAELGNIEKALPIIKYAMQLSFYDTSLTLADVHRYRFLYARALEEAKYSEEALRQYELLTHPESKGPIGTEARKRRKRLQNRTMNPF